MSVEPARAKAIFLDAVEHHGPHEWPGYLDEVCAEDALLRRRVEALLRGHASSAGLLDKLNRDGLADQPAAPEEQVGSTIGPYRLLEQIGEGGMGIVYMAERTHPVRRKVALKIIKPGMDTRQVIARFEAERQALAMMDHPNIARVFNADATASGRPYFVMELVHGIPITDYCDRERLSVAERLELFVLVCRAVQHAHQKGIIHRDLKPSNVLVTVIDGAAVPKVIDFGVAKATDGQLTDKTLCTGFHQFIGTPLYMSPEQAELSGVDVDTRSDIFALGVLLYELLTGTTPIEPDSIRKAAHDEIRRLIREQEPPTPSARLSTQGEARPAAPAGRDTGSRKLSRIVRRELDWIVMKALEKDLWRRYETANDFAADVMRHLTGQPVEACPPTPWYRFAKFARRNRGILMALGLVSLALVAGLSLTIWQALRATKAEQRTAAALDLAQRQRRLAERHLYDFRLRHSQEAIELGQAEQAQEILASLVPGPGQPETRGFAWHYLWRLSRREIELFEGHESPVICLAVSPDGHVLATGDADGTILLSDAASGATLKRMTGHTAKLTHLVFSPGGDRLISVAQGQTVPRTEIWAWDARTSLRVTSLDAFGLRSIVGLKFSASGRRLLIASHAEWHGPIQLDLFGLGPEPGRVVRVRSEPVRWDRGLALGPTHLAAVVADGALTVYDTETLAARWSTSGPDRGLAWPMLSPDGRLLAAEDGLRVVVWEAATGRVRDQVPVDRRSHRLEQLALGPDGASLLVVLDPLRLWLFDRTDTCTGPPRDLPIAGLEGCQVVQAIFSPDGSKLALTTGHKSGGQGPTMAWDVPAGRLHTYPGRAEIGGQIVFAPDSRSLFLDRGSSAQRWSLDRPGGDPADSLAGHTDEAWSVAFSPRGDLLATGSDDTEEPRTIKLWEPATGRLRRDWHGGEGTVSSLAFSPDGNTLASGHLDATGEVRLWDAATGALRRTLRGHSGKVRAVAFRPGDRLLASAGDGGTIRLWDSLTGELLRTLEGHANQVRQVAFSPDGTTLASACYDRTARLWDVATGRTLGVLRHPEHVTALGFSPDAAMLATSDELGRIRLWTTAGGTLVRRLRGGGGALCSLTFSPDGRALGAAGADGLIRLWDVLTGQELLTLRGHVAQINALAFSPDGRTLASCSHDGAVKLWHSEEPRRSPRR